MTEKLSTTFYYGRVAGGVLTIARFEGGNVELSFTLHQLSVQSTLPRYMAKGVPDDLFYEAMYKLWKFQDRNSMDF